MTWFYIKRKSAAPDGGGGGDPNYGSRVLIMNMQGTDGSTSFVDDASAPGTFSAVGNAQIDTAQFIYGTSSALFDGSGDAVSRSADLIISETTDWSIEQWFRLDDQSYTGGTAGFRGMRVIENGGGGGSCFGCEYFTEALAQRDLWGGRDSTALMMRGEINFSASTWYFYQLINNNTANTFTLYIYDGAMTSYASTTRKGLNLRDIGMRTGSTGSTPNNEHKGHIGPMRVTSGVLVTPALPTDIFPTA